MNSEDHSDAPSRAKEGEAQEAIRCLTKVQRDYVRVGAFHGDIKMSTVRALIRKGLFYIHIDSPNGQWGMGRLTPLGLMAQAAMASRAGQRPAKAPDQARDGSSHDNPSTPTAQEAREG